MKIIFKNWKPDRRNYEDSDLSMYQSLITKAQIEAKNIRNPSNDIVFEMSEESERNLWQKFPKIHNKVKLIIAYEWHYSDYLIECESLDEREEILKNLEEANGIEIRVTNTHNFEFLKEVFTPKTSEKLLIKPL